MTVDEAKELVLNVYPESYSDRYGIGRKSGVTFVIRKRRGEIEQPLAIIFRTHGDTIPISIYDELVWKQAAYKIMKEMVERLEL